MFHTVTIQLLLTCSNVAQNLEKVPKFANCLGILEVAGFKSYFPW